MPLDDIQSRFWRKFVLGVGAEPREVTQIRGASGVDHPVLAIGTDDKTRRLILVTEEYNARNAAMMQADVQATIDAKVIVARAIAIDLGQFGNRVLNDFGSFSHFFDLLKEINNPQPAEGTHQVVSFLNENLGPTIGFVKGGGLRPLNQLISAAYQLGLIEGVKDAAGGDSRTVLFGALDAAKLLATDVAALDRAYGVCPLLLSDFTPDDIESINVAKDGEPVLEVLERIGIKQYFYPPIDHTALGLIDRGVKDPARVLEIVQHAPELGHPYGPTEILDTAEIVDVVDALQDRGLVVEGEFGAEISDSGRVVRQSVKFKSREGLVSKLINRFDFKFSLKDFFDTTR